MKKLILCLIFGFLSILGLAQSHSLRCKVNIEFRQYCFEGRDCGLEVPYSTIIDCPEEVIDSLDRLPEFDTIRTYRVINYSKMDVRKALPEDIVNQLYLMFDMEKIRANGVPKVGEDIFIALFWDNYFDNAHNLSGQAFIAKNPGGRNYSVAVQFGRLSKYDVIQKEKTIGSPWPEMNPGGTIYYDEDGREILRLIYGR